MTQNNNLMTKGQSTGRKDDSAKAPMALIPPIALEAAARAFQNGLKYGQFNYLKGLEATRVLSALLRHVARWNAGEELDPDSGVHHLGHAIACCAMLLHLQQTGKLVDDRWRPDGTEPPDFRVYDLTKPEPHSPPPIEGSDNQAPRSPGAVSADRRTVAGGGTLQLEAGKCYAARRLPRGRNWWYVKAVTDDGRALVVHGPEKDDAGICEEVHLITGEFPDIQSGNYDLVEEIDPPTDGDE